MPVNPKKVFVVHGRNLRLKKQVFAFLRKIGLSPISWNEAVRLTGISAPYIGQVLDAALNEAQAVVVLLTGDDEIELETDSLHNETPYQPRPNVLFEAGMAFTRFRKSTILVEFEKTRPFHNLAGRDRFRLSDDFTHRMGFIHKLQNAGCEVVLPSDQVIRNTGDFSIV